MQKFLTTLIVAAGLFHTAASQTLVQGDILTIHEDPLVGVSVGVPGSAVGTATDANGHFEILVPSGYDSLQVSYLGYTTVMIPVVAGRTYLHLEEVSTMLETVEVPGFAGAVGQARRRAESVQKIPESVVTYTTEHIEASGINSLESFASQIPNLSFNKSQNIGVNFINIRGIGQIRNGDSPVAFLIDGVYIPDPNVVNMELFDLAMIEVVKGPQGTLYGKNAIGGAINILTQTPTNAFKNRIKIGVGNGGYYGGQLVSSGHIIKDKLFYRLAGSYKSMDGVIRNSFLDTLVDYYSDFSLRGQLRYDFNNRLSLTVEGQYSNTEGGATYSGHAPSGPELDPNDFNYVIDANVFGESTLKNNMANARLEWNLGRMKFQSITSFNKADRQHAGDLDFLSFDILRQDQESNSSSFNQEFRLGSHAGSSKLDWDLGVQYQTSDRDLITRSYVDFGYFLMPPMPLDTLFLSNFVEPKPISDFTNHYTTFAGFAFGTWHVTSRFDVSAGLRVDHDQIEQDNRNEGFVADKAATELQPKLSLAYDLNPNVLVYANYGRGYRSGGYNAQTTSIFDAEYDGETSNNFELGLKTSTVDHLIIFNMAAFYVDFSHQQQFAVALGLNGLKLGNYNYEKSKMYGVEAEAQVRTSRYLDVLAGFGLSRAEIVDGGMAGTTDRSVFNGNRVPLVPQTTANVALKSLFPISPKVQFSGFLNLALKGKIYWHENNVDASNPYTLLDGRVGVTIQDRYDIYLWGANIGDTKYYQEYGDGAITGSAAGDTVWPGQPRTYGVEVGVKF